MIDSEDHSVTAHPGSAVAQITGERVKGWLTSVLLGLSIAINVWLTMTYRQAETEQRLAQYNLDWFKTHEFSDLKSQVELNDKLISIFGGKSCDKTAR